MHYLRWMFWSVQWESKAASHCLQRKEEIKVTYGIDTTCFFQLNTDIKSLSDRDRALSLPLCYIQRNAGPTEFGDKIPIHLTSCQRIDFYWHTGEQLII